MNVRQKLAKSLFMIVTLLVFSTQLQAQTLTPAQQAAYDNLVAGLQGNADQDESGDEAVVQAARDAGLPDSAIAGALSSQGRSSDQAVAAMLPAAPTQAQVNAVSSAMVNATDNQGNSVNTGVSIANVGTVLNSANVPINLIANVTVAQPLGIPGAPGTPGAPGIPTPSTLNTLPATAAGGAPSFQFTTSTLTPTATSSGPSITNTAATTNTPVIPVTTTDSLDVPTIVIPQSTPLHII